MSTDLGERLGIIDKLVLNHKLVDELPVYKFVPGAIILPNMPSLGPKASIKYSYVSDEVGISLQRSISIKEKGANIIEMAWGVEKLLPLGGIEAITLGISNAIGEKLVSINEALSKYPNVGFMALYSHCKNLRAEKYMIFDSEKVITGENNFDGSKVETFESAVSDIIKKFIEHLGTLRGLYPHSEFEIGSYDPALKDSN